MLCSVDKFKYAHSVVAFFKQKDVRSITCILKAFSEWQATGYKESFI